MATDYEDILRRTFDDGRLSRSERDALGQVLDEAREHEFALVRQRCFAIAQERLEGHAAKALAWCEDVIQLVASREAALRSSGGASSGDSGAAFSPGGGCRDRLARAIGDARRSIDACVFTITDDVLSEAMMAAHRRGVQVRLITDDDKAHDLGSDAERLARAGILVRTDRTERHMHHKFALFDGRLLITGSYNWTRQAATHNQENLVVLREAGLLRAFQSEFGQLWERFA